MKLIFRNLSVVLLALIAVVSCETVNSVESEPSILNGEVVDSKSGEPVQGAYVRVIDPQPAQEVLTDAQGKFSLTIEADSLIDVRLQIGKEDYIIQNYDMFAAPGRVIQVPQFKLVSIISDGDDDDDDDETPDESGSGRPFSITLASISNPEISVYGVGRTQQSFISFVVTDSAGVPVDINRSTNVTFSFGARPDGGETLGTLTATTNEEGIASTVLESGTVSGVVQILAEFTRVDGVLVKSTPVNVVVRSGLPDADHYSLAATRFNLPFAIFGQSSQITAFIGDRYGNPVEPGHAVYYTTDGGLIQGAAFTTFGGQATSSLTVAAPFPNHPMLGPGFGTVKARTIDENNTTIEEELIFLFSGYPVIQTETTSINIPHQGTQTIYFTVTDQHGNPLTSGTSITVTLEGDNTKIIGDTGITLEDALGGGPGITEFSVTISDDDKEEESREESRIKIEVSGENGKVTHTITGQSFKVNH